VAKNAPLELRFFYGRKRSIIEDTLSKLKRRERGILDASSKLRGKVSSCERAVAEPSRSPGYMTTDLILFLSDRGKGKCGCGVEGEIRESPLIDRC
jgi:hypothetical protein